MKIVCVGYLHGSGGAERQIIMLSNALSDRGHEVHLIILAENNSKYDISRKVIVHDLSGVERNTGISILNRFIALKDKLKVIRPDISIHYWFQSAYYCAMMNKSIAGKIIYSERGDPGDIEYKGLLGVIRKIAFGRIDGFVFQSEGARDYFCKSVQEKAVVIHNSVFIPDGKFLEPCKVREKKIVNVGRLHPQKNQKLLINSFYKIAPDFPDYTIEIYGDGELKGELQEQIDEFGLTERISLKGTSKNVLDYVYTASLFVLSSDYEGMPNALMEAMAIGVPCISTDCRPGGARSLICNDVNGWITPVGDADMLASCMRDVLSRYDQMDSIVMNAMNIRYSHSDGFVFNEWEKFCKSLLEI